MKQEEKSLLFSSGDKNHFFLGLLGRSSLAWELSENKSLIRDPGNPRNTLCWGGHRGLGSQGINSCSSWRSAWDYGSPENDSEFMGGAPQSWGIRKTGCGKLSEKKEEESVSFRIHSRNCFTAFEMVSYQVQSLCTIGTQPQVRSGAQESSEPNSEAVTLCIELLEGVLNRCRSQIHTCSIPRDAAQLPSFHHCCQHKEPGKALPMRWHRLERKVSEHKASKLSTWSRRNTEGIYHQPHPTTCLNLRHPTGFI